MAAFNDGDKQLADEDGDDDYFSNGGASDEGVLLQDNDSDDDDDDEIVLAEVEPDDHPRLHRNYDVLTEADIRRRIGDHIMEVSVVLSVSKVEASILLLHYNWSVSKVQDAWFIDENKAREKAGLLVDPSIELSVDLDEILCGICFESYSFDRMKSTSCGHRYCNECWSSYIKTAIADGPGSLFLKCPEPSCRAAVGEDIVNVFASEEEKRKYSGYLVMSYIEENKMIKYCPGAGCENAIKFVAGSENFDVSCPCSHNFCWNCSQEGHRPVDCETVRKWMSKNSSEAENVSYILAFTKPCPKCGKPIEKNMGCNRMTCRPPCLHQFCWLCLQSWKTHAYGACNGYKASTSGADERERAKKYIMRYTHYYERWATNQKSMKKATADLKLVQDQQIEILGRVQAQPEAQLGFLTEAWQQIVECRKVLTWTYAFGYYLSDEDPAKRNLFEFLQGQAESALERLHDCAEKELSPFLQGELPAREFVEFRKRLSGLTRVTRNFFENLVTALENGLSDVNSLDPSSVSKKHKPDLKTNVSTVAPVAAAAAAATSQSLHMNNYFGAAVGDWFCDHCTFENDSSATFCRMCGRGSWTCNQCTFANSRTSATCEICSAARQHQNMF